MATTAADEACRSAGFSKRPPGSKGLVLTHFYALCYRGGASQYVPGGTMNRLCTLVLLIGAVSVQARAVTVETADGDWSKLPQLSQHGYDHLNEKMQAKLYEIAQSKQCPSFALKAGRLDFSIGFAVQYAPDGTLAKVVMPKLNCAEAESVVGGTLLEMIQGGDYSRSGKSLAGWYQGGLGFTFAGDSAREPAVVQAGQPKVAPNAADPNQIVCEKETVIGTRLATARTCMSRAQWSENKRLTRQQIEQIQVQRPCNGNC